MSSKLNIIEILAGHCRTLSGVNRRPLLSDKLCFFGAPTLIAAIGICFRLSLNESQISLLVNFGAIFTALLLSVLVLVYDQENKSRSIKSSLENSGKAVPPGYDVRIELLRELYLNLSYSILIALLLIAICFLGSLIGDIQIYKPLKLTLSTVSFTPIALFLVTNLMLTIVMVVKRLHILLTTEI